MTLLCGRIIGYWAGSAKAMVKLADGRTVDVTGSDEIGETVGVGDPVLVEFDSEGQPLRWHRPDS